MTHGKRPRPSTLKRITPEKCCSSSTHSKRSSKDDGSIHDSYTNLANKTLIASHISDDMAWSEISSSLGTGAPLHESYHSNSMTTDSGVDCHEISMIRCAAPHDDYDRPRFNDTTIGNLPLIDHDDDNESLLNYSNSMMSTLLHYAPRRCDSDTALSRTLFLHDSRKLNTVELLFIFTM